MDCSVWIVFFYSTNREAWVVQGMECVPLIIRPSAVGNTACSPRPTVACCGHTVHPLEKQDGILILQDFSGWKVGSAQRIPGQVLRLDR